MLPSRLLISSAAIYRAVPSADGYGGTLTLDTSDLTQLQQIAQAVPCRVASLSTRQKARTQRQDKTADVDEIVVFMNYNPDIYERDRIVVMTDPVNRPQDAPVNYDILNIKDPGLMHHHLEITVQVVK